jgi:hypothetical protein
MITRQRKVNLKTDQRHSNNDDRIKENLPTALLAAPSSNGYFHVGTSSTGKQNNRNKRRQRNPYSKENYRYITGRLWILIAAGSIYCFCTSYYTLSSYLLPKQRIRTPVLSNVINNFTIIFPPRRFTVPSPRKLSLRESQSLFNDDDERDFGGLDIRFLEFGTSRDYGRAIYHDSYEDTGYEELWEATDDDENVEYYYAFDDDAKRNPLVMYDDPDIHLKKTCRRTNWHRQLPITCNTIHEFNFQGHVGIGDTKYVG